MRYYLACRFLSNLLNSKYDYGNFQKTHLIAALLACACLHIRSLRTAYLCSRGEFEPRSVVRRILLDESLRCILRAARILCGEKPIRRMGGVRLTVRIAKIIL